MPDTNSPSTPDTSEEHLGTVHENLEGWIPSTATEPEIRAALEKAFDYRGDVTITLKDGRVIEGYVFDRKAKGASLSDCVVRLMPKDETGKLSVPYSDIAALAFTGRDTAAGKSFAAWVKKYNEKKAAGETNIGIESESLD
ncbi:MAG: hypothetical protein LAN36_03880 [Acidobacteriia bacterium]|nr:hypothetical protein [Terriglobia bacterium]